MRPVDTTQRAEPPECPRTEAILAVHLDGDVQNGADTGFDFVCGDSLAAHLIECGACQLRLQRARRLDAVLATDSGRDLDAMALAALERRWFAAIEEEAAAPVAGGGPRRAWIVAAAVTLAMAIGVVVWSSTRPAPAVPAANDGAKETPVLTPCREVEVIVPSVAPPSEPADPGEILIAADAAPRFAEQAKRSTASRAHDIRFAPTSYLRRLGVDDTISAAERLATIRLLVQRVAAPGTAGPDADLALIAVLAGAPDRTSTDHEALREGIHAARGEARFVAALLRHLGRLDVRAPTVDVDDLGVVVAAARLGESRIDASLLRVLRRRPALAEPIAAALRSGLRTTGAGLLLLDAWQSLADRGLLGEDPFAGQTWFAGQADATFADVANELRTTTSSPRRVHCLLALGFGGDPTLVPLLLDRIGKAPHAEAHAAAFALSRQPSHVLARLVDRAAHDDGAFLLRAALARAGLAGAEPWLAALPPGPRALAMLREGSFAEFPPLAQWFRGRPADPSD